MDKPNDINSSATGGPSGPNKENNSSVGKPITGFQSKDLERKIRDASGVGVELRSSEGNESLGASGGGVELRFSQGNELQGASGGGTASQDYKLVEDLNKLDLKRLAELLSEEIDPFTSFGDIDFINLKLTDKEKRFIYDQRYIDSSRDITKEEFMAGLKRMFENLQVYSNVNKKDYPIIASLRYINTKFESTDYLMAVRDCTVHSNLLQGHTYDTQKGGLSKELYDMALKLPSNHLICQGSEDFPAPMATRSGKIINKHALEEVLIEGQKKIFEGIREDLINPAPTDEGSRNTKNEDLAGTGFMWVGDGSPLLPFTLTHQTHLVTAMDSKR